MEKKEYICDWCGADIKGKREVTHDKKDLCEKCADHYWNGCSGF